MNDGAAGKGSRLCPVLLPLLPLLLVLLCHCAGQGGLGAALGTAVSAPGAFLLDLALFAAAFFLLLGCTGRAWIAWLPGLLPLVLDLISHYKLLINGAPLLLSDLSLAPQLGEVLGFAAPQLRLSFWVIGAPAAFLLILLALLLWRKRLAAGMRLRLLGGVAGLCLLLILILFPFSPELYAAAAGEEQETLLRFYAALRTDRLPASDGDAALLERLGREVDRLNDGAAVSGENAETPTVIFLMSESFFDLARLPGVSFDEDPQPHFHALQSSCSHGRFYSNTYAGGTGFVEMEVLTGLCSAFLRGSDNLTSLPDERYAALPCITDVLTPLGYRKTFLHSYNDKLYNRRRIYASFGFDAAYFEEDFPPDAEKKDGRISDMALSRELIRLYEAGRDDGPQLFYVVSVENHQPYTPGRYGAENDLRLESDLLTEEERESLRSYAYAARDADAALKRLTDYFAGAEEKVILVFWGDHMPNLKGENGTIYEKLGMVSSSVTGEWSTEELAEMLATDYVIWTNFPGFPAGERAESCTLLGFHTLQYLGLPLSDYYRWLEARIDPFYLLYRARFFGDRQGGLYPDIPPEYREAMEEYAAAVRDTVYGEGRVFRRLREEEER